jgi:hypothetical protein
MLERAQNAVNATRAAARAIRARAGTRVVVWGSLLAGLAVVLDFLPLFDVLGYDFAAVIGLVTALAATDVGQGTVARWRDASGGPTSPALTLRLVGRAAVTALALLALPLLLSLANVVRIRNCNLWAGLGFFLLLPVATALYAAPAGVLAGLASARRGRALALALPVASLLWTLRRLYHDPPVFAFDPFFGYFPGPIYDEALRPPGALLHFRLVNLVWIATAVALGAAATGCGFDPRRWRRRPLLVAAPLLAASLGLYHAGGPLAFHVDRDDLRQTLDRSFTTDHFVVHYAASEGRSHADLALTGEDLEFRYHQLRDTFGIEPKLPVTVWEFPSADAKKRLVGAGHTLYARPWSQEIFVHGDRFPSNRLHHEMAHVFAGAFGDPLFGIALAWRLRGPLPLPTLAMGLVEGVAEAATAADPDGDATIHEEAAAMIAAGLAPPLADVVGAGFSTLAGRRAYTIAGSFSAFLLATRGPEKLRALYRSAGDFDGVYRVPFADLERDWRQFLARLPLTAREKAHASEEFRRPAIFKRVCARELAARVAEARGLQRSEPARAVELLTATCRDDPSEPLYRLALAEALARAGERERALTAVARIENDGDVTTPVRAQAATLSAEIAFANQDYTNAQAETQRALGWAASDSDRRQGLARLRALNGEAARATLGRVLFGDAVGNASTDPVLTFYLLLEYARLHPVDPMGPYLVGRQLLGRDPARALPWLARACGEDDVAPPLSARLLPPEFVRECRRMTADAAYRVGDFPRARTALERLAADAVGEAERLRALDMRARVDWAAGRRTGPVAE